MILIVLNILLWLNDSEHVVDHSVDRLISGCVFCRSAYRKSNRVHSVSEGVIASRRAIKLLNRNRIGEFNDWGLVCSLGKAALLLAGRLNQLKGLHRSFALSLNFLLYELVLLNVPHLHVCRLAQGYLIILARCAYSARSVHCVTN